MTMIPLSRRSAFPATVCLCLVALTALRHAGAQNSAARTRIAVAEIRQAVAPELRSRLPQDSPVPLWDLELPLAVPVLGSHTLRVSSVCREADADQLRFQLACAQPGACLPFLAYVRTSAPVPARACLRELSNRVRASAHPPVVQPGERVTAVLAVPGLRVTASVHCLEPGGLGEIVLVRAQEGRILRARVTGPGRLEAIVP